MILRATAVQRRIGPSGQAYIDGRYEVQWTHDSHWLSLGGISTTTEEEWLLVASLLTLGARTAYVVFQLVDATPAGGDNGETPTKGCSDSSDADGLRAPWAPR